MTNYMGKRRLEKILLQMLSDRPQLQARIKSERDFMKYRTYRGSEWLKIWLGDCRFEIYADGEIAKGFPLRNTASLIQTVMLCCSTTVL